MEKLDAVLGRILEIPDEGRSTRLVVGAVFWVVLAILVVATPCPLILAAPVAVGIMDAPLARAQSDVAGQKQATVLRVVKVRPGDGAVMTPKGR